ncbi:MAG: prepilin-type N-terminal cleavage/methylation domain-containing protein [Gammaproteobacteria bacterium]|jgi:type IV pilus assembly protein PilE|nr:prepilin-type N-terminal cleavage/methylation domain-containing protein [Gammaproteobacteria bacterium]MBP6053036.1 prepilin-type N-terminal cleavage/methylation domain-containing protein [Pseudomonadales bacterium]MBK6583549.1 prepilin-type N-terminal cleavage/methylation domain-containing protein [Gammaproteobacteria bacterium]MBK7169546.1 prepilin-type N-terminal cleavage/methylation domain-containing protein [Gammaproteobacteria bacterium]MBK7521887.1 prepilin-type N-terminal cleavage/me
MTSTNSAIGPRARARGFSLIELVVALAMTGILVAIALPGYRQHILRGHRSAAQGQMLDIANRQLQFLLANRGYAGSFAALGYALPPELATRYRCESMLGVDTVPSFRINCTAIGAQSDDGDLSLSSAGVRAPAGKW